MLPPAGWNEPAGQSVQVAAPEAFVKEPGAQLDADGYVAAADSSGNANYASAAVYRGGRRREHQHMREML